MSLTVVRKSRVHKWVPTAIVIVLGCGTSFLIAQNRPAPPPQAQTSVQSPKSTTAYDPTRPETQPSLTVDRDPVLSPDAEDNVPVGAISAATAASAATGRIGEIQKGKGGIYTLHEDVNEVLQYCTVLDEKGRVVNGLKQSDFRVWEDGVPQAINSFRHQDLPVSMGILIDNSGSMRDKRQAVDGAALEVVKASNPADEAFIVNFSDKAYLDTDFTSNIAVLQRGLAHFDAKDTTALYDAVAASADEMAAHAKQPKQVLLIITDGADNASRLRLTQAVHRVQNLGGPVVYSIGLLFGADEDEAAQAKASLEELSRETGGVAYFPDSLESVNQIADEVARDIRNQYTVGYHSSRPASLGGYRRVRVEASAPHYGKLTVRTRRGYYPKAMPTAQPQQTAQSVQAVP